MNNKLTDENLREMLNGLVGVTPGPWFEGFTPFYLAQGQVHDNKHPLTIRSPHHTEEIATVWTCLLPVDKNAAHIARCDPDSIRSILLELLEFRENSND